VRGKEERNRGEGKGRWRLRKGRGGRDDIPHQQFLDLPLIIIDKCLVLTLTSPGRLFLIVLDLEIRNHSIISYLVILFMFNRDVCNVYVCVYL